MGLSFLIRAEVLGFGAVWNRFICCPINLSPLFHPFNSTPPMYFWIENFVCRENLHLHLEKHSVSCSRSSWALLIWPRSLPVTTRTFPSWKLLLLFALSGLAFWCVPVRTRIFIHWSEQPLELFSRSGWTPWIWLWSLPVQTRTCVLLHTGTFLY